MSAPLAWMTDFVGWVPMPLVRDVAHLFHFPLVRYTRDVAESVARLQTMIMPIVTTALGLCDFISAMDTARVPEWNCWYHISGKFSAAPQRWPMPG